MTTPAPETSVLPHLTPLYQTQLLHSPIYAHLLSTLTLHTATHGKIRARLPIAPHHLNSKGTLHGTVSACIVDWAAGMAILSCGGDYSGVSTDLSVSFLGTATVGDVLEIVATANKVGGTLAFTGVEIWGEKGEGEGKRWMVATGSHTKFEMFLKHHPDERLHRELRNADRINHSLDRRDLSISFIVPDDQLTQAVDALT
ncbi:Thioesterase/thiol ester dehydrase-isomerase [Aspergillus heteromorphus CBS 117.55]|uniref:Thioesterase/thiol ester dehydrase-isomerase n=1 Tax=Aspergillus heteromorphus CBS 117.55 TaxID=1448321 RepID=A0A317VXV7_9EURO|nr:Thioesterase/thiol ester dehydrase-isomerase [Aspergillus heteromorphus CBS 117.55]PWY79194.1 Thioesterase/thiol ester dehydrase-isomerase [Aspergillus heteromorphus CBS 117.55]